MKGVGDGQVCASSAKKKGRSMANNCDLWSLVNYTHTLPFNLLITRNQEFRKEEIETGLKGADLSLVWQIVSCFVV